MRRLLINLDWKKLSATGLGGVIEIVFFEAQVIIIVGRIMLVVLRQLTPLKLLVASFFIL